MRIYISIPITGHDIDEVKERADILKQIISSDSNEVITPFDVCADKDKPYSHFMGRDIEALLDCDAIFMAEGWQSSKGCNLEHHAALLYDKHVFTEIVLKDSKAVLL